jgi:hypothetical protein
MEENKSIQSLLSQIETKESKIKQLKDEVKRQPEVQLIRDKERVKKHKNTILIVKTLIFLLSISVIGNVLLLLR